MSRTHRPGPGRYTAASVDADGRRTRRSFVAACAGGAAAAALGPVALGQALRPGRRTQRFRRISTQFIAALADPDATSGDNARQWGLWRTDPGPRGVRLDQYERLMAANGVAPAGWKFEGADWWLEEHGLIMERPEFPLPAGDYMVTGNRDVKSVLSVRASDRDGTQRWALSDGATIYDVTHLRCRSARYTPAAGADGCSPARARPADFPVHPGGVMPPVEGCDKQDYAVLIVIGVGVENG